MNSQVNLFCNTVCEMDAFEKISTAKVKLTLNYQGLTRTVYEKGLLRDRISVEYRKMQGGGWGPATFPKRRIDPPLICAMQTCTRTYGIAGLMSPVTVRVSMVIKRTIYDMKE